MNIFYNMKILILGANGMLGQELIKVFKGDNVVAWDREDLDITNWDLVNKKIKELGPEIVINAAAYNAVDKAEEEKEIAFAINADAVKYIAQTAMEIGAIFIHFGTDYIFAGVDKNGYAEDAIPNPQSVYAQSKELGERYLQENCDKYYLIRLSKLFGKIGLGTNVKKSFVDVILKVASEKKEIEVVDEEYSSPTYAPDLAQFTKNLILNKASFGIYHGANSGAGTWFELAKTALNLRKISCTLIPVASTRFPRPALRPQYSVLLNTKMPQQRPWQDALKEYLG